MKKIIYLFVIAFLAMNYSCSKESLNEPQLEKETEELNVNEFSIKPDSSSNAKNGNADILDENGNPIETYHLYLDMDYIQANYSGTYTGSFNQYYQNEMSTHFTIHSIEYAGKGCGNVERWVVTKSEFDAYLIGSPVTGGIIVRIPNNNGDNNSSTASGNGDAVGWGDEDGNAVSISTKPPRGATTPTVPTAYIGCF